MDRALQRAASLVLLLAACRVQPYSAEELATATRPDRALVRYLGQPGADAAVCDPKRKGAAITHAHPGVVRAVARAGRGGDIPPERVAECLIGLWRGGPPSTAEAAQLAFLDALVASAAESPEALAAFTEALTRVPERPALPVEAATDAARRLRSRARKLDPAPKATAEAALDALDAHAGLWRGEPVTALTIANLDDDALLLRWARTLPPERGLRDLAASRLIDVRVERSAFPSVRAAPEAAKAALRERGRVEAPAGTALARLVWEPPPSAASLLRLHQQPHRGRILVVPSNAAREDQADPQVALREGLSAVVDGWPAPIPLCPPADPYDPTPCWPAERLQLVHPYLWLDGSGLKVRDELELGDLVRLLSEGTQTKPQIVSGGAMVEIPLGLHLEPVPSFRALGSTAESGPTLRVDATDLGHGRLLFKVQGGQPPDFAVVVPIQDHRFSIASIGGDGKRGPHGKDGADGAPGSPGRNASCPSQAATPGSPGERGGDGADGGTGGTGGAGGTVHVTLRCGTCEALEVAVRRMVVSQGGEGGEGGHGGKGGRGGEGGPGGRGASCAGASLPAAANGATGPRGQSGRKGPKGAEGPPGQVKIRVIADK